EIEHTWWRQERSESRCDVVFDGSGPASQALRQVLDDEGMPFAVYHDGLDQLGSWLDTDPAQKRHHQWLRVVGLEHGHALDTYIVDGLIAVSIRVELSLDEVKADRPGQHHANSRASLADGPKRIEQDHGVARLTAERHVADE